MPFLLVSVRDAGHADPASPLAGQGLGPDATAEERLGLLREGLEVYNPPFPALFDADGEVERAYDAFPKRLVVVGADARIVFDGGRGRGGNLGEWDLAEVEEHVRAALARGVDVPGRR